MENQQSEIRIYVACLAAYNNGILNGAWIDAEQNAEDINNAIRDMLAASPIKDAEEFAIHDYEGFEGIRLSEYSGIDEVAKYAAFIAEHGALGSKLFAHYGDLESAQDAMDNHYHGCFASVAEFAEELSYTSRRSVLVVSTEGFVLWSRSSDPALKSGLFLKVKNRPPIELSAGSLARQRDKIPNSNFAADHDAHVWFNQPCREQVLFADQYDFTISLLHFDDAGSTFIVEEEECEEDTFERFERRVPGQSWLT